MNITRTTSKQKEKLEVFIERSGFFKQPLFEEHPEGYYALDLDGRYVKVNKVCEEYTEYTKEELYQLTFEDLLLDGKEKITSAFKKIVQGDIQKYECTIKTKNHQILELEVTNLPIIVDDEVIGVYGTAKDVTQFNQQQALREENEKLHHSLVEHSPDGIIITQSDVLVYANKEASILLGATSKEAVIGNHIYELFPKERGEMLVKYLENAEKGLPSSLHEEKLIQMDGTKIDVEMKIIPTIFKGEKASYFIIRDITEKKLAHEVMINSEKLSVAGQLAAGIAHEIRNPITAIKGFLQLMEGGNLYKQEYFPVISAEINRIELILSELLALAKPQLNNFKHKNIISILQHIVALTQSQAILHNIRISTEFHIKQGIVFCDENKLKQVFINFIKNAIEAMKDGGTITVKAKQVEEHIVVEVIDEGKGIPKEVLDKIGTPFFTTKENGTGLGVMVSYEIIKHHKGEVKIDSDSRGTSITIKLPTSKR
ncbi:PAS domain-containing sensor histidine kinase [Metabacillus litoralis]|uniref:PAS domain-containing sensor histidine kinase n=1 Tax=Metabacillus litoralis TaxID=152268 RepID=UPI001CFE8493|nr:PAS domain-containing sensor histidine kinase [Metabacillus litoralis]